MSVEPLLVTERPLDPEAALRAFRERVSASGAIVSFVGLVRGDGGRDPVLSLELQTYPGFTERAIAERIDAARARWPLEAVMVHHRSGRMAPGEPIVLVAAASVHRRAAFEAADHLMDMLKGDVPFWKKETRASGARWIEPRDQDRDDAARWGNAAREGDR